MKLSEENFKKIRWKSVVASLTNRVNNKIDVELRIRTPIYEAFKTALNIDQEVFNTYEILSIFSFREEIFDYLKKNNINVNFRHSQELNLEIIEVSEDSHNLFSRFLYKHCGYNIVSDHIREFYKTPPEERTLIFQFNDVWKDKLHLRSVNRMIELENIQVLKVAKDIYCKMIPLSQLYCITINDTIKLPPEIISKIGAYLDEDNSLSISTLDNLANSAHHIHDMCIASIELVKEDIKVIEQYQINTFEPFVNENNVKKIIQASELQKDHVKRKVNSFTDKIEGEKTAKCRRIDKVPVASR